MKRKWRESTIQVRYWGQTYVMDDELSKQELQRGKDGNSAVVLITGDTHLTYEKWYAGHFHCDRRIDKLQIMFRNAELLCKDIDLDFSME